MRLSIVIVNYNVKYFLEQCLRSVTKALEGIEAEVLVIDNASTDGSVEFIKNRFPQFTLIANDKNLGFSKANNLGIKQSTGEYVLLLNPDTVVEENTFRDLIQFMTERPDAGAVGVKMIDGSGTFLPESKRAIPYPSVAFWKVFGFASMFPKSKTFGQYHLSYLDKDKNHEVEVLSGAFMFMRREALDKAGLLDEDFFMYGEDIDLSYRILKAGYKNYYNSDSTIIHYKGESTKKGSLNYVRIFYQAMAIFARKHFSSGQAQVFGILIQLAIWFRAGISVLKRIIGKLLLPIADAAAIFGGMFLLKVFWEQTVKAAEGMSYPEAYMFINVPVYIAIWLTTLYYSGGYDKPVRMIQIIRGLVIGTIIVAASYGFFEETYRFSRAMILLGGAWSIVAVASIRLFLHFIEHKNFQIEGAREKRVVIVGSSQENKRVLSLLNEFGSQHNYVGAVCLSNDHNEEALGDVDQLADIINVYHIDEVIFCAKDVSSQQIITLMTTPHEQVDFKIVPEQGFSIIGSKSKNSAGDLYAIDINLSLAKSESRRNKRLFDIMTCLFLIIGLPVHLFLVKRPLGLFSNILNVFIGKNTWVGYAKTNEALAPKGLPPLPKGVLSTFHEISSTTLATNAIDRLNFLYAKDYSVWHDFEISWKGYRELGKR